MFIMLPADSVMLDGSGSFDDHGITKYEWRQISGEKLTLKVQFARSSVFVSEVLIYQLYLSCCIFIFLKIDVSRKFIGDVLCMLVNFPLSVKNL